MSALGIVIMIGAAWILDRASRVPDLFVQVLETEEAGAAVEAGKA